MKIEFKYGKTDIADCFYIRKKVFIKEQGFSEELEFDNIDDISYHLLITKNEKPVATARLFYMENEYHCGRIAILEEYRGKHIGLIIMEALEKKVKELKGKGLFLSAQVRVTGFYKKCGYLPYGEEYMDEHCPHIMMKKEF